MLAGAIDGAHNRHPIQDRFAESDQPPPQESGGHRTDDSDQDEADDQAGARDVGNHKLVETGKDARHLAVDQFDGRPGDVDRQKDRRGNKKTCQEPGSQAPQETGFPDRSLGVIFRHGTFLRVRG